MLTPSTDLQGRRASSASARSASGASKSIAVSTSRAQEAGLERAMNNLSVKASSKPNAGLSLELKPLKIGVHGVFVNNEPYRTGTPLQTSHMVQLPVVGVGFRLATSTTFVLPRSREIATILDSGAPFFLVRKDTFDSQDELAASAIRDEHNNLRYYEPHFGSDPRRLRGFLAHGHVKIGPPRGGFLEITDQRFYACDNHPLFSGTFQALIGTAPEPFVPQVGELESDCPTIVKTVAEQNGLRVIQGTYLRPWNEDPSNTYTLTGNIDIGSVDSHLCSGQVIEWTKRSSELPYHLGVKTAVNYGNSSTGYQRLVHWNGERYEATEHVLAMLDTGVPTIAFNKAMFAAWKDTLRYTSLPYVETEASMGTFLQIPISHILLLRNLQFTFLSAEQGEFSVKIPSSRLILPSRIYRALGINAYEGYAVMSTIGITSSHHVTLGIPFCEHLHTNSHKV